MLTLKMIVHAVEDIAILNREEERLFDNPVVDGSYDGLHEAFIEYNIRLSRNSDKQDDVIENVMPHVIKYVIGYIDRRRNGAVSETIVKLGEFLTDFNRNANVSMVNNFTFHDGIFTISYLTGVPTVEKHVGIPLKDLIERESMTSSTMPSLAQSMDAMGISQQYIESCRLNETFVHKEDSTSPTFDGKAFLNFFENINFSKHPSYADPYNAIKAIVSINLDNNLPTYVDTLRRILISPFEGSNRSLIQPWVDTMLTIKCVNIAGNELPLHVWQVEAIIDEFSENEIVNKPKPEHNNSDVDKAYNELLRNLPEGVDFENHRFTQKGTVTISLQEFDDTFGDTDKEEFPVYWDCMNSVRSYISYMEEYSGSMVYMEDIRALFVDPLISNAKDDMKSIKRLPTMLLMLSIMTRKMVNS